MKKCHRLITIFLLIIASELFSSISKAAGSGVRGIEVPTYQRGITPYLSRIIDQNLALRKYQDSLLLLDQEISNNPANIDLMYKKASIYADLEQWNKAIEILNKIIALNPNDKEAANLLVRMKQFKQAEPHHELGFDQDEAYVSDLKASWAYSSLHYYYLSDYGNFGGRVNYSHRFGTTAEQYEIEAYPRLSNNLSLGIIYGYSKDAQTLYPTGLYRLEGYFSLPYSWELSPVIQEQKYSNFSNQAIYSCGVLLGKYYENYFAGLRPSYYSPVGTKYYELIAARYFSDADNFLSLRMSVGKLPDIGDLPPFDQLIIINQHQISLNGQVGLNKKVFIKGGINYAKQLFPSGHKRDVTDIAFGLIWRF